MSQFSHFLQLYYYQFFVSRWHNRRRVINEDIGSHSAKTAVIAVLLADLYKKKYPNVEIDRFRILWFCLTHDIAEVYTGDLPAYVKKSHSNVGVPFKELESVVSEKFLAELPDTLQVHEELTGIELSFLKLADMISGFFYSQEECSAGNAQEFDSIRRAYEISIENFPELGWLAQKFLREYGQTMSVSSAELFDNFNLR